MVYSNTSTLANLRVPRERHPVDDRTHTAQPYQVKLRVPREGHQVSDKDGMLQYEYSHQPPSAP